jgi:hypothetical protein
MISAVFLWLACRDIDFRELYGSFFRVQYGFAVAAVAVNLFSCWLRAMRWQYLMRPVRPVRTVRLYSALMIGFMVNNILPFRLGELMRGYAVKRSEGISFTASMGTIIIERIIDVLSLLVIFAALTFVFPFPAWIKSGGVVVTMITVACVGLIYLLLTNSGLALRILKRMTSVFSLRLAARTQQLASSFLKGITLFHSFRSYAVMTGLTILIWMTYVLSIYVMFHAVAFPSLHGLDLLDATVVMVFTSFAIMIPAAPGYVGTFHEIAKQSLVMFRVDGESALGFAILMHAYNYVAITAIGFAYFFRTNLRLQDAFSPPDLTDEN